MKNIFIIVVVLALGIGGYLYVNPNALDKVGCLSCKGGIKKDNLITEKSIGLRHSDLYTEKDVLPNETNYSKPYPGSSTRFERAYENSPPMIPHNIEGILPITKDAHACLGCHSPDVAPSVGATSIPKTHFTDFRPKHKMVNGVFTKVTKDNEVVVKEGTELTKARYNCTQCHAPQSSGDLNVKNKFVPDFRDEKNKKRSNLIDTIKEGVK